MAAGACMRCNALRLKSSINACFSTKLNPRKWKFVISASSVSSFSLLSCKSFSENRSSSGIFCRGTQLGLLNKDVLCIGLRPFKTTACVFTDGGGSKPGAKQGTGKIKAKLAQMKEMKEDIFTVPNLLSTLRILATPVLGYLIISEDFVKAVVLFGAAGITDMLDGFIARNFKNQKSVLGTILDPLADKIMMSTLTVSLTVMSLLPVPLTALILSRDALLVSCAFYFRFKSLPSPKTISRYFDMNFPTVELRPNLLGKANTVLQLALVGCSLLAPVCGFVDHPHLQYLWYVVAGSTVLSSVSYVVSFKASVKYLK